VKIPNGTAAVSAEAMLVDESRSLGNREGRAGSQEIFPISASQKTCLKMCPRTGRNTGREDGSGLRKTAATIRKGCCGRLFVSRSVLEGIGAMMKRILCVFTALAVLLSLPARKPAHGRTFKQVF
jgi:hypothetical protein